MNTATGSQPQSSVSAPSTNRSRHLTLIAAISFLIIAIFVFYKSQTIGGTTWDEKIHREGIQLQFDVAAKWLQGDRAISFQAVPGDLAFYGIVPVFPAYLAECIATQLKMSDSPLVYIYGLHATAFLSYLLTLLFSFLILARIASGQWTAAIGTMLLALYPLWLGYSFFDYKDMTTAAFATMALYGAIGTLQAESRRETIAFVAVVSIASILISGTKIAALAIILPEWVAVGCALLRRGYFLAFAVACIVSAVGTLAITPVAWSAPVAFLLKAVDLMSRHAWGGCVLADGHCLDPQAPNWSAAHYMLVWFLAQIPVSIALGMLGGTILALRNGAVTTTIAASAIVPVALIALKNSTLYDGLRHLLFEIPMVFILAILFWNSVADRWKNYIFAFAVAQIILFSLDDIAMFPYNYVYFNLPTRQFADESNFETDYWSFSLRQALRLSNVIDSKVLVMGRPLHLVAPFLRADRQAIEWLNRTQITRGTDVVLVSYTRSIKLPTWCSDQQFVTRSLSLTQVPIHLSFAARCKTD